MEETFKAIEKLDTINGILALTYKTIPQEVEYLSFFRFRTPLQLQLTTPPLGYS